LNYYQIINEALETRLTDLESNFKKEVTLYHGTTKRIPSCIIDPAYGRINIGTRLSKPRYSTWWCKDPFFPFQYASQKASMKAFIDLGLLDANEQITVLNMFEKLKHLMCTDEKNKIIYYNEKIKDQFYKNLKEDPSYVYKVTVPWKLVSRGHDISLDEYTLDIPVKAEEIIVTRKELEKYVNIKFISESECIMRSTEIYKRNGGKSYFHKPSIIKKLIYYPIESRRNIMNQYGDQLTRRKQEKLNK